VYFREKYATFRFIQNCLRKNTQCNNFFSKDMPRSDLPKFFSRKIRNVPIYQKLFAQKYAM
jgi:hypothetical protein